MYVRSVEKLILKRLSLGRAFCDIKVTPLDEKTKR